MNESMYKYMKVGIIYGMIFPTVSKGEGPILETIRKILTDEYFNAIEITWIKNENTRKAVKKMLDSSHMTVTYGAHARLLTTGLNINDLNEEGRQKALITLKEGIDEAYEMGAEAFTFLSGKYLEDRKEECYSRLVISTMELCEYAKVKGNLKIVLEVFDHGIDKKSLIGPANLAKRLVMEICSIHDNFGLTVDLSHIPLIGESFEKAVLPVKEYLVHAHIGNCVLKNPSNPCYGDVHPRFGYPGGENDVEQLTLFLKLLMDIGFLNERTPPAISFEVKPCTDEDAEIVIANSKRALNMAWARL
jgi:sugar phosphate isomerase/epimerase